MTELFKRRDLRYLFRKIFSAEVFLSVLKITAARLQRIFAPSMNSGEKTCRFLGRETEFPEYTSTVAEDPMFSKITAESFP